MLGLQFLESVELVQIHKHSSCCKQKSDSQKRREKSFSCGKLLSVCQTVDEKRDPNQPPSSV
jgi:hypothetical protein